MTRVLVTGGTGVLGREVVSLLLEQGKTVRVMSRRDASASRWPKVEWAQAVLDDSDALDAAVKGVDVIVHAATAPFKTKKVDYEGTIRLLEAAKAAHVGHIVYISIVGIDKISTYPYYRTKLKTERLIMESGLPWTILRATQFHTLLDMALKSFVRFPIGWLPTDFKFQPIDPSEVAARMCELVEAGPSGRAPDVGGPEVRTASNLASAWLRTRNHRCKLFRLPLRGSVASGFRQGLNTCPEQKYGVITWEQWLNKT